VPAAAVIQSPQALSGFIGRKGSVGGLLSFLLNFQGLTLESQKKLPDLRTLEADRTVGVGVKSVDIDRNTKSEGIQLGRS
jgi:hypothetical protein